MSDNKKIQVTENTDEWINWIEEAIAKEHLKFYEYNEFSNFQQIGAGSFGKVYRAKWKNLEKHLALKSFFNLDNITVKEIVREVISNLIYNKFFFCSILYWSTVFIFKILLFS
jgi:serine/threonine protein kinase